jgi:NitT/TauT family transport system ATP-binding protein
VLDERSNHTAPKSRILDKFEDYIAPEATEQTLHAIVSWSRFGELFA